MSRFCTACRITGRQTEAPLDALLAALLRWRPRSYRCTAAPDRWIADCPVCRRDLAVEVHEPHRGAKPRLTCRAGCRADDITRRLAQPELLTIEELQAENDRLRAALRAA